VRAHYANNRAAKLAQNKLWRQKNPEHFKALLMRRRARLACAAGACAVEQLRARITLYGGLCWVPGCDKAYEAIDHVIPLAKGGSNWPSNLRPICKRHNSIKGTQMPSNFMASVAI